VKKRRVMTVIACV